MCLKSQNLKLRCACLIIIVFVLEFSIWWSIQFSTQMQNAFILVVFSNAQSRANAHLIYCRNVFIATVKDTFVINLSIVRFGQQYKSNELLTCSRNLEISYKQLFVHYCMQVYLGLLY